jgi:1,4-dihydroxy-2-naphthoate octaprenyltransferase
MPDTKREEIKVPRYTMAVALSYRAGRTFFQLFLVTGTLSLALVLGKSYAIAWAAVALLSLLISVVIGLKHRSSKTMVGSDLRKSYYELNKQLIELTSKVKAMEATHV